MALRTTTEMTGLTGSPYLNLFHFTGTGSVNAALAAVAASTFWNSISSLLRTGLSIVRSGEVEEFDPITGAITAVHSTDAVTVNGAANGEVLPFASQALVRWRTGLFQDGREIRGRTFIPGLTQDSLDNGIVLASTRTTIANAAGALDNSLAVWSRPRAASAGPPVVTARSGSINPAVSSSVAVQFAVLRSRRD